jgi:hypothetical protein
MSAEMNFDATGVKPATGAPDPLPPGEYRMAIVSSEVKPTANGKGKYLKLEFVALDDPHKGRKVWTQLNIVHENEQTQKIAQEQLSAICHATGQLQVKNSGQLHNVPMMCKLIVKQDPGYDPKNEIRRFKAIEGAKPAAAHETAAATHQLRRRRTLRPGRRRPVS